MQIQVVDEHNQALAHAEVLVQTASTQSAPVLSNENGMATIPSIMGAKWLHVSLSGYKTAIIDMSSKLPTKVSLEKITP